MGSISLSLSHAYVRSHSFSCSLPFSLSERNDSLLERFLSSRREPFLSRATLLEMGFSQKEDQTPRIRHGRNFSLRDQRSLQKKIKILIIVECQSP